MHFKNFINGRIPVWPLTALSFITAVISAVFMPQEIPVHWNSMGIADGYGSRLWMLLMPCIILIVTILTGRKKIRYVLAYSKMMLNDIQLNWYTSGVCILLFLIEITIISMVFAQV